MISRRISFGILQEAGEALKEGTMVFPRQRKGKKQKGARKMMAVWGQGVSTSSLSLFPPTFHPPFSPQYGSFQHFDFRLTGSGSDSR